MSGRVIVFLGPSLAQTEAQTILRADYRPPAGQGDIFRACAKKPAAIGLIDGVFKDAPTVRHREILWALSRGIPVFGAASMGALRAAELSGHGMIGVGLIYRWYRRFALLPDDAVAVTHSPAELGAQPISDALVDIRRSLSAAIRQNLITRAAAAAELERITALPFAERRLPAIASPAAVPQKAIDARALLHRLAAHKVAAIWPDVTACTPPAVVHAWLDDLRDSGLSLGESI
jgi:hypothetical protein